MSVNNKGLGSVASENRDRQLFMLGSLKSSQSLTSNGARIGRPSAVAEPVSDVKDNVAGKLRRYTRIRRSFVTSETRDRHLFS